MAGALAEPCVLDELKREQDGEGLLGAAVSELARSRSSADGRPTWMPWSHLSPM